MKKIYKGEAAAAATLMRNENNPYLMQQIRAQIQAQWQTLMWMH